MQCIPEGALTEYSDGWRLIRPPCECGRRWSLVTRSNRRSRCLQEGVRRGSGGGQEGVRRGSGVRKQHMPQRDQNQDEQ
eukprot:1192820-Prorocentrum_minimum.AAC.3